jgi:PhoPQ-activated pathogenicity-related protein
VADQENTLIMMLVLVMVVTHTAISQNNMMIVQAVDHHQAVIQAEADQADRRNRIKVL